MVYLWLSLGLIVLVAGAELLVRGAAFLAELARISPLVIGLTVVAFGTSAPELAVSSVSSLNGDSSIALGNVLGSNVFNVLLILGLSAVIVPLAVSSQLVRLDVPIMIAASVGVGLAALDGAISRLEGCAMLVCFALYTAWLVRAGRKEMVPDEIQEGRAALQASPKKIVLNIGWLLAGLGLLVWGAQLLVDSATAIARDFGVSDLIIGLTIVAGGTSLPELATSLVAAIKGQRDIAVGNVVGSNMFNLLIVLATAGVLSRDGIAVPNSVFWFDIVFMVGVAMLCWPIFLSHAVVSRGEGALLLLLFFAYTGLLIADSMQVDWAERAKPVLVLAAVPAALIVVTVVAWRDHRRAVQSAEQG